MKSLSILILIFCANFSFLMGQSFSLDKAENFIKHGEFQNAINVLDNHLELYPSDETAYIKRAYVHEILGQSTQMRNDLQMAEYLNPFANLYYSEQARASFYSKKKYGYNAILDENDFQKSPISKKYYNLYFDNYELLHKHDSILQNIIYKLSNNEIDEAELILSTIEDYEPINWILYDLKGLVHLKKNRLEEAIQYFTKSIKQKPNFPLSYHNRAVAYKLKGEYDKAENDLLFAVKLNEDISILYFTLAKLSENREDKKEAILYYKEALAQNPSYIEAKTNYSMIQKTLGNYDDSIIALQDIIEDSENNSKRHFLKGGIFLTYGEYDKAIEEYESFLFDMPNDDDGLFNLGLAQILNGSLNKGCENIENSITLDDNAKRVEILRSFCPNH